MSAYKLLYDVSKRFETYSRSVSVELFSVKTPKRFEDIVSKKTRDVLFFTSKLRLLQAKPLSDTPSATEENRTEELIIQEYGEEVSWKIIEQKVVKALTQSQSVKTLLTTPNRDLEPAFAEKKEMIIEQLIIYANEECRLRFLEAERRKCDDELLEVRRKWDLVVGKLKDREHHDATQTEDESDGPLRRRLQKLTDKTDLMRWLIGKMVTSRFDPDYDWLADPHDRLRALAAARRRDV